MTNAQMAEKIREQTLYRLQKIRDYGDKITLARENGTWEGIDYFVHMQNWNDTTLGGITELAYALGFRVEINYEKMTVTVKKRG